MNYKYTIIQENRNTKNKLTYEFAANDEDEMVEELNSFMHSIGFAESGNLTLSNDIDSLYEDLDSEVENTIPFGKPAQFEINPELEGFKNFEFDYTHEVGDGQRYSLYETGATWPFPLDRPSQPTLRIDSEEDSSNVSYYGT